jgi:hypothetical protein
MSNLEERMAAASPKATDLEELRAAVRRRRDLANSITHLEEQLATLSREKNDLDTRILPEMFLEARVDRVGLPAEGNYPALDAVLTTFYKAAINSNWTQDKRQAAFRVLEQLGLDSIIRREVKADFSPGHPDWQKAIQALRDLGIHADVSDSVHWKTLTSAIQQLCESGKRPSPGELDALGAFVGQVVQLKPRAVD